MTPHKRNRLICGVGVNDADYSVYISKMVDGKCKAIWVCPFYLRWRSMIVRCYSESFTLRQPTYVGCSCVTEWHLFSNFRAWMENQIWEEKELDKDLLVYGNKVYGPETCVFIDRKINVFLPEYKAKRGVYPTGVSLDKSMPEKPYRSRCNSVVTGKTEYLGHYKTPEEAHQVWLAYKLEQAYILAAEQTDERVAKALIAKYENYRSTDLEIE